MAKSEAETKTTWEFPEEAREHLRAARREMRASVEAMMPPGFLEHRRAARREALLAVRSLIDKAIEGLES
jgi:hypothetical protein